MPPVKFVLFTTQRTGSTWVIDCLNSHPQVKAYSELFLDKGQGFPKWGGAKDREFFDSWRRKTSESQDESLLGTYLDGVFAPSDAIGAVGFKLMYGQAGAHVGILPYCVQNQVRFIHLIRSNFLELLISREAAVARDLFHSRERRAIPDLRLKLDTQQLIQKLEGLAAKTEAARRKLSSLDLPHLELHYEELRDARDFSSVLSFLEVEELNRELKSSLKRIIRRPPAETLANYEEVRETLLDSRFASFIQCSGTP